MGIYFDYDKLLQQQVKQAGATWSQSNKTWYVELNRDNFEKIKLVLKGYAGIDYTGLKTYLEQKKNRALMKTPVQYPVHLKKHRSSLRLSKLYERPVMKSVKFIPSMHMFCQPWSNTLP